MPVIVRNRETNKICILIGASYSYFKDSRESFLGGALFPHEEEGTFDQVAVTYEDGRIEWAASSKIEIIEIDGEKPKDILSRYTGYNAAMADSDEFERCPGCQSRVKSYDRICHSCGLTLISED